MASNVPATPGRQPLDGFDKLSPSAFLYKPKDAVPDPTSPKLIALFTWMAAQDAHIAKYIVGYQAMYPSSAILLVKAPMENVFRVANARAEVVPAIPAMKAILGDANSSEDDGKPELLLHVFSNGGCIMFSHFFKIFTREGTAGDKRPRFPTHISIMDSCPGHFNWGRTYKALAQPLPNWMGPLVHLVVFGFVVYYWFAEPVAANRGKMGRVMNADEVIAATVRRVYVCSDGDEMVAVKDVEEHRDEAEGKGLDVRLENFGSSPHVAHLRTDGKRYWGIVKDVWEGW